MMIWFLNRHHHEYDEFNDFVVRAGSEQEARQAVVRYLAEQVAGANSYGVPDDPEVWLDPTYASCERWESTGPSAVLRAEWTAG